MPPVIFIFANGRTEDGAMVRQTIAQFPSPYAIAADGGVAVAQYYGIPLDIVIGDMDSVEPATLKQLESDGVKIERHPPEKNETDLELALQHAIAQNAQVIRIFGAIGGRFDQMLANVYLMALPALLDRDVAMVAGKQRVRLLQAGDDHTLAGDIGDTISLLPFNGDVHHIKTHNLKYPLADESLYVGPARGVSNVIQDTPPTIRFEQGLLLLVHTIGRAE